MRDQDFSKRQHTTAKNFGFWTHPSFHRCNEKAPLRHSDVARKIRGPSLFLRDQDFLVRQRKTAKALFGCTCR